MWIWKFKFKQNLIWIWKIKRKIWRKNEEKLNMDMKI